MIVFFIFIMTAFADSFGERPDVDFYAHPLIEEFQQKSEYFSGKIIDSFGRENNWYVYLLKSKKEKKKAFSDRFYKKGSSVIFSKDYIVDYDRRTGIILLFGFYFLIFIFLTGKMGIRIFFSFIFLLLIMLAFFIPFLLSFFHPVFMSIIVSFISSLIFAFSIFGFNRKSFPVIIGTFSGLFFTLLFVFTYWKIARLNGFTDPTIQLLNYSLKNYFNTCIADVGSIILAGLIFSITGMMLDIVVDVSSYMFEAKKVNPTIDRKILFNSGINVGKDILVAICNALLFVYFGVEIFVIIGKTLSINSSVLLFNMEWFSIEILKFFPAILGFIVAIISTSYSFVLLDE